jgi:hypothetical protein
MVRENRAPVFILGNTAREGGAGGTIARRFWCSGGAGRQIGVLAGPPYQSDRGLGPWAVIA